MPTVYLDGHFLPEAKASIPITDRGFLFGDGVFTSIRVENGAPLYLETHLKKLNDEAAKLNIIPPSFPSNIIDRLIRENDALSGLWRLKIIVSGGDIPALDLPKRSGRLLITLTPYTLPPPGPLKIGIYPHPVGPSNKSLSYIERLQIMAYAKREGWDDALTLTPSGIPLETSFGNIFWKEEDQLYTPDPSLPLYLGTTLERTLAEQNVIYTKKTFSEISEKAQFYRTNALSGVRLIHLF